MIPWLIAGGALLLLLAQTETAADTLDQLTDTMTDLDEALNNRNVRAFLAMIRAGEGTADADGYRRIFGGRLFANYLDHPRVYVPFGTTRTSAAGAYQIIARTWDEARADLDLRDFSPPSQDLAAVYLIRRRGALADVIAGRFDEAVRKCAKEWASLPGSPYGQPTKTLAQARATYQSNGGTYA